MEGLYALIAFGVAWLVAQVSKIIIGVIKGYKGGGSMTLATMIGYCFRSGGMPSAHTASFMALCVYLGCALGFTSGVFALAIATLIIIMYDAIHVRYAVGEQGKALNALLKEQGKNELPLVEGHTLAQVAVGGVLGIVTGIMMYWIVK